jgi:hypothetical protein
VEGADYHPEPHIISLVTRALEDAQRDTESGVSASDSRLSMMAARLSGQLKRIATDTHASREDAKVGKGVSETIQLITQLGPAEPYVRLTNLYPTLARCQYPLGISDQLTNAFLPCAFAPPLLYAADPFTEW